GKADGSLIRVRDLGRAVLGAQSYDFAARLNGRPTAGMLLYLRPRANSLAVRKAVERRMQELSRGFPPGVTYTVPFDTTPFVTASNKEVVLTLAEAMILVALVVFIFLQSWRATLIPLPAVPVSVVVEAHACGVFGAFNRWFALLTVGYEGTVDRVLGRPRAWLGAVAVLVALAVLLWRRVPSAFIPTEDKGYFAAAVQLPDAASLQRSEAVVEHVEG